MAATEHIKFPDRSTTTITTGNAGLKTQAPGAATTVSSVAAVTGGLRPGGIIETDK